MRTARWVILVGLLLFALLEFRGFWVRWERGDIGKKIVWWTPVHDTVSLRVSEGGRYAIGIEHPPASTRYLNLTMSLAEFQTKKSVPLTPATEPWTESLVNVDRRELFQFEVQEPGDFDLTVSGLPDEPAVRKDGAFFLRSESKSVWSDILFDEDLFPAMTTAAFAVAMFLILNPRALWFPRSSAPPAADPRSGAARPKSNPHRHA